MFSLGAFYWEIKVLHTWLCLSHIFPFLTVEKLGHRGGMLLKTVITVLQHFRKYNE